MLTIDEAVKDAALIRPYINQQLAIALVKDMGYSWPPERLERIAAGMGEFVADGIPAARALASAFDLELLMYGDGSMNGPIGLIGLNTAP